MTTAIALAQILIPLLPKIGGDVEKLISWISGVRKAAQQTGEWPDSADAAFRDALIATKRDPAYAQDPPLGD